MGPFVVLASDWPRTCYVMETRYDPNSITVYVHPLFVVYSISFHILPRVTKAGHRPSTASSVFTFDFSAFALSNSLPCLRENAVTYMVLFKGPNFMLCISSLSLKFQKCWKSYVLPFNYVSDNIM